MVSEGQIAPDFTLPRDGGGTLTLSALRPAPVVIVTYGGDGTPTCTTEVMEFNALLPEFSALGVKVIGLSKDSVKAHDKFVAKMGIGYPLASDAGTTVMDDWGAHGDKIFFGKPVVGVLRKTFLIDAEGRIARIWPVDRVKGHAAAVLDHLKAGA